MSDHKIHPQSWKSGLASELINLEENINILYEFVNVHSIKIITKVSKNEEEGDLEYKEKLGQEPGFESVIDEYFLKVNISAHNICALISVQTDFDLPIPIVVILRLAAKVGLLRWKDYKKNFSNMIRTHVYSLTPRLIEINQFLFKSVITVMGTNIIPFCPYINQTVSRTLDWTRSSNLIKFDENLYYSTRTNLFDTILFTSKQLSLNINLEPSVLNSLIEVELVESLESLTTHLGGEWTFNQEKYIIEALTLLEELIIIYSGLLPAPLEYKIKSYTVQLCVRIYREFKPEIMSLPCRRQLLKLLQTIANQPYATSTTEISHHIFELVMKVESDPELVQSTRRLLKVGFSHRPVIVSHLNGHNYHEEKRARKKKEEMEDENKEEEEEEKEEENKEEETEKEDEKKEEDDEKDNEKEEEKMEEKKEEKKEMDMEMEMEKEKEKEEDMEEREVLIMLDSFVNKLA